MSNSGHSFVHYIPDKFRMVEFRDGYHTLSNSSIWRGGSVDKDAICIVWQGRSSPEGQGAAEVRFAMKESNRLKDNRQPIGVSKLWIRYAKAGIKASIVTVAFIFVTYIIFLAVAATQLKG